MEILLIIILVILGILFYFFKDKIYIFLQSEEKNLPFRRKDFLLNIPERQFFEGLQQIIPAEYIVFPQIILSNIVQVTSNRKEFWNYQNKINRKTIDFVIFEKQYLKPVIAIEYDGKTHNRSDRQERDDFVNKVLSSAGMKSLHIKHQKNINFEEVKNKINELLTPTENY
jgi:very-short-patch-repair endonuclease